ncbi:hypothetical protein SAY87_028065 [Trapa incisa]|uniref:Uncharacterized protein n=1 Tax=Trapa incisa TaxID=236973 RepID=A0AAN7L1D8_9MYRT|nr:hypothetical protein SAY87_028065 [Trapa incisa]
MESQGNGNTVRHPPTLHESLSTLLPSFSIEHPLRLQAFCFSVPRGSLLQACKLIPFSSCIFGMDGNGQLPLVSEALPPPLLPFVVEPGKCTHRSIETLAVVLAVITILGVMAGIVARLCGGRHFEGGGDRDIEGWVESKCRSCIDGGLPPLQPPQEHSKPNEEQDKKSKC